MLFDLILKDTEKKIVPFYVKCTLNLQSAFDDSKDAAIQTTKGGLFHHLCSGTENKPVCLVS